MGATDDCVVGSIVIFRSLDFQVHVYGTLNGDFETACRNLGVKPVIERFGLKFGITKAAMPLR